MLNILVPLAGESSFFNEEQSPFPKPMYDVKGKMMIERVVQNLSSIRAPCRFTFVINEKDCSKHYLDNVLKLLTNEQCEIIKVASVTKGAVCTCLLAIEQINTEEALLICNGDQVIDVDLNQILDSFTQKEADAGVATFESIHPRWSFVRLDEEGSVIETSEKRPISKQAIAGFYFFKKGEDFVAMAKKSILKDRQVHGSFYIAPVLNEFILEGKKLAVYHLQQGQYHSFYSPEMVEKYNENLQGIAFN